MHTERLKRLEALLRKDADNPTGVKFDLGYWAAPSVGIENRDYGDGKWDTAKPVPEVSCGTTACAMGLAAISGEFKADGLAFETYFVGNHPKSGVQLYVLQPEFFGETGFEAAASLFKIGIEDAHFLFDPDNYGSTPKGREGELFVADRIAEYIATDGANAGDGEYADEFEDDEED